MEYTNQFFKNIAAKFSLEGQFVSAVPFGDGHINDTLRVETLLPSGEKKYYCLQRINKAVFADGAGLMNNMVLVTDFIREIVKKQGGDPLREVLTPVSARDGKPFVEDEEGYVWRVTLLIPDVHSESVVVDASMLRETGRAFGLFFANLDGFDASQLCETIPNFHNTPVRFASFRRAVEQDVMGRAAACRTDIDFALAREDFCSVLTDALAQGRLPLRVTHNDTKINNLLLDDKTGKAVCVIDLDTVMPGLAAYDFGDSIRSGANPAAEDEPNLDLVTMDLSLYKAFAEGFLSSAGSIMTDEEIDSLPVGAKMMTFECGIRFLADHLEGDHYFKIHRPGHNLDRARTQFKMVQDMEAHWDEMLAITRAAARRVE